MLCLGTHLLFKYIRKRKTNVFKFIDFFPLLNGLRSCNLEIMKISKQISLKLLSKGWGLWTEPVTTEVPQLFCLTGRDLQIGYPRHQEQILQSIVFIILGSVSSSAWITAVAELKSVFPTPTLECCKMSLNFLYYSSIFGWWLILNTASTTPSIDFYGFYQSTDELV